MRICGCCGSASLPVVGAIVALAGLGWVGFNSANGRCPLTGCSLEQAPAVIPVADTQDGGCCPLMDAQAALTPVAVETTAEACTEDACCKGLAAGNCCKSEGAAVEPVALEKSACDTPCEPKPGECSSTQSEQTAQQGASAGDQG